MQLESLELSSTQGGMIDLSKLEGKSVIFVYPRTSPPDGAPEGWEMIPGAKGCTAESCTFRDLHEDFLHLQTRVFGVSTQTPGYQQEAAVRLHLSYPLLSDSQRRLEKQLELETFEFDGQTLYRRTTFLIENGMVLERFVDIDDPAAHPNQVLQLIARKYR